LKKSFLNPSPRKLKQMNTFNRSNQTSLKNFILQMVIKLQQNTLLLSLFIHRLPRRRIDDSSVEKQEKPVKNKTVVSALLIDCTSMSTEHTQQVLHTSTSTIPVPYKSYKLGQ
jgi:hypothetical protein